MTVSAAAISVVASQAWPSGFAVTKPESVVPNGGVEGHRFRIDGLQVEKSGRGRGDSQDRGGCGRDIQRPTVLRLVGGEREARENKGADEARTRSG